LQALRKSEQRIYKQLKKAGLMATMYEFKKEHYERVSPRKWVLVKTEFSTVDYGFMERYTSPKTLKYFSDNFSGKETFEKGGYCSISPDGKSKKIAYFTKIQ